MALGGSGGGGKASSSAVRAGEAFVEINADDTKFVSAIKRTANKLHSWGSTLKQTGVTVGAAGLAALTPLLGLFDQSIKMGDAFTKAADRMGATAEAASKLAYAAKQSDTALEAIVSGNTKLTKSAIAATEGSEDQALAFKQMGISAEQFLALDADERFAKVAGTLEGMGSELDKNRFGMALFSKSFAELRPLLESGEQGMRDLFVEAEKVGAVISSDRAKKSTEIGDTIDKTWTAVKMTFLEVGFVLLGFQGEINKSSNAIVDTLQVIRTWINNNRALVIGIALISAGAFASGLALVGMGYALTGLVAIMKIGTVVASTFYAVMFSPIILKGALVVGVITALVLVMRNLFGLLQGFNGVGPQVSAVFSDMLATVSQTFGVITKFLEKGNISKAFEALWVGVQIVWADSMLALQIIWNKFKASFVDGWHDLSASIRMLWSDLAAWILRTIAPVFNSILEIMAKAFELTDSPNQAKAIRDAKIDPEAVNRNRDAENNRILDERKQKQLDSDIARSRAIADAVVKINDLKTKLEELEKEANAPVPEIAPMPRGKQPIFQENINRLGSAVAGTFSSSDFRGALGLGPAKEEAEKQTGIMEKQLKVLQKIEQKDGAQFD